MQAKEIMTKDVVVTKMDNTVEEVVKILVENNISGLPVVNEENKVVGIITEGDLIYRSKKLQLPSYFTILDSYIFLESTNNLKEQIKKMVGYKVEDVMTKDVITAEEDDNIEDVATLMANNKINRIPIVRNGILVGIISRRDIIRAYARD
ncbi:CBS domain-containing protein [Alkaliphilus peptidifermentans]|uniref:CBS domain-containing protein n=1 Tax=Alkaliphilus peptidifermentans DSM 18978 TaxID=1120976 RepID=A0A1G5GFM2_9FIRM|nr:CBS domain-containing protein [Alkaliphilus peptidifermentans]SCY50070.1 CBS domain-containing protein [Alkaliphilus peptidifermentans DSM 18978]